MYMYIIMCILCIQSTVVHVNLYNKSAPESWHLV